MRPYILALAFALAAPLASLAGDACRLPTVKIIGLDYHTARAKLIKAGNFPKIRDDATYDNTQGAMWRLGYLESEGCGNGPGLAEYRWHGFAVFARDCWRVESVICR